ncbi:MAG: oligoendopeptidase F, partial [Synergistes sp.]|nr:oligoendopeptidase F [Synergistes sp.]
MPAKKKIKRGKAEGTASKEALLGRGAVLPERSDIPEEYRWRLEDIFPTQESREESFAAIKERLPEISAFAGTLSQSPERLLEFFKLRDELAVTLGKLFVYANMRSHENTADSKYQGPANRVSALSVEFSAASSFVDSELLAMPRERLSEFASSPLLSEYSFSLRELLRMGEHILSEAEELILARAGDMAGVPDNAFSMLTNADMEFPPIKDEENKVVEMSEERAVSYMRSPKRAVRKAAFDSLYTPYRAMKNTLGATFDGMLKCEKFYAECRRYESPRAAALDRNNIPLSVYDNLVETIEKNLEPMYRYVALRRRAMRLKEVHFYDLYVPLVRDPYKEITWSEA